MVSAWLVVAPFVVRCVVVRCVSLRGALAQERAHVRFVSGGGRRRLGEEDHRLTVEVRSAARALRLELVRDLSVFAPNYRAVEWSPAHGFRDVNSSRPACLYSGTASEEELRSWWSLFSSEEKLLRSWWPSFLSSTVRRRPRDKKNKSVFASACSGSLRAVVRGSWDDDGATTYEVAYAEDLGSYVIHHHARRPSTSSSFDFLERTRGRRDSEKRRQLQAHSEVSCAKSPNKTVEIVAFNDASRFAVLGDDVEADTAAVFALVRDIWLASPERQAQGYGVHGGGFACRVEPRLVGQVTWRDENPVDIAYLEGDSCAAHCCQCGGETLVCGPKEVSAPCLLASFSDYVHANKDVLRHVFNGSQIDNAHLLSHRDFAAGTLGVAWVNGMCSPDASSAIEQVRSFSLEDTARIVAHELGHNFGMDHDLNANGVKNLMFATAEADPTGTAIQFSQQSRDEIRAFMDGKYGTADNPACLENDVTFVTDFSSQNASFGEGTALTQPREDDAICGDGLVEGAEECDVGLVEDARCCGGPKSTKYACRLLPGCECVDGGSNPCCQNGTIRSRGTVCRQRMHEVCDEPEVCDGRSPECPVDRIASPGTPCVEANDKAVGGACFKGDCKSLNDECAVATAGQRPYACVSSGTTPPPSSSVFATSLASTIFAADCSGEIDCASDGTLTDCAPVAREVANGVPCLTSDVPFSVKGQCAPNGEGVSECVDSSFLKTYHWDESECRCVDEAGVPTQNVYCAGFRRLCRSAAPTVSSTPTRAPTLIPSPAPSVSPFPTAVPTAACDRESSTGGCGKCDLEATVVIWADLYPSETHWSLHMVDPSGCDVDASTASDGLPEARLSANRRTAVTLEGLCPEREYTFDITDDFGDGICCVYGRGNYSVSLGPTLVAQGAEFQDAEATTFRTPSACANATDAPSATVLYVQDSPAPTKIPSPQPTPLVDSLELATPPPSPPSPTRSPTFDPTRVLDPTRVPTVSPRVPTVEPSSHVGGGGWNPPLAHATPAPTVAVDSLEWSSPAPSALPTPGPTPLPPTWPLALDSYHPPPVEDAVSSPSPLPTPLPSPVRLLPLSLSPSLSPTTTSVPTTSTFGERRPSATSLPTPHLLSEASDNNQTHALPSLQLLPSPTAAPSVPLHVS